MTVRRFNIIIDAAGKMLTVRWVCPPTSKLCPRDMGRQGYMVKVEGQKTVEDRMKEWEKVYNMSDYHV